MIFDDGIEINIGDEQIFDSHAHYDDKAYDADRDQLLQRLNQSGVCGIINCGSSKFGAERSAMLAQQYPFIYAAVGIHPEDIDGEFPEEWLRRLAQQPKVVAIGEIGLDYHWDTVPRNKQAEWFSHQMEIANELYLPVVIHDREAHGDTMELIEKYAPKGVLHCFSGSAEMAKRAIKLGLYIGIGGVVTFKNARKMVEVVSEIPLDRMLVETDAPYLAPVPYRGSRCHSGHIVLTADKIAEIRGVTRGEILSATLENTKRLFSI